MDSLVVLLIPAVIIILIVLYYFKKSTPKGKNKQKSNAQHDLTTTFKKLRKQLTKRVNVSHNTIRFVFGLPTRNAVLGLPVGKHISVRVPEFKDEEGSYVVRPYTPVSSDKDLGMFELVIKVYETGTLTKRLEKLEVGDVIEAKGPEGNPLPKFFFFFFENPFFQEKEGYTHANVYICCGEAKKKKHTCRITYTHPGTIELEKPLSAEQQRLGVTSPLGVIKFKKLAMIAGGTGITPMLQVIHQILSDPKDETEIHMIFANRSIDDILLREELEILTEKHSKFHLHFTLDKAPQGVEWHGGVGFVTEELVKKHLPKPASDVLLLECGPPLMIQFLNKFLAPMGYKFLSF
ncbi:NADH-cytochrome b5 reductase 2 [Reticulomyxa filosa]|uniref:cytochrome-b5 reductase n=1 Tax=Reticulomyxa filosa TaxID=46433 RepID=X6NX85_RETFI|nr:NADH-cytochrome b5 reductase 2 [Reticulomyxa filosa]|eukprot:ETO30626.1 NADH-cytochrome b5 reductase 2 [Reticulomyxa filosa]